MNALEKRVEEGSDPPPPPIHDEGSGGGGSLLSRAPAASTPSRPEQLGWNLAHILRRGNRNRGGSWKRGGEA